MGINIKDLPNDFVISKLDKLVGTDNNTDVSYNYPIQGIIDLVEAVTGGTVTTDNIKDVVETVDGNWIDVINAFNPVWSISPAEVGFVRRYDKTNTFLGLYLLIKSSTTTVKYGLGESVCTAGDFEPIRLLSDTGEVNTMSSYGAGVDLLKEKDGVDFVMQSLKAGVRGTIQIGVEADGIHIDTTAGLGEVNTISTASGTTLYKEKNSSDLVLKGLVGENCTVSGGTDYVVIKPWGKIIRSTSFTVSSTDKQRTIQIDNGATPVVVTIPDTLGVGHENAFVQLGTGEVSFVASGSATILGTLNKIKGSLQSAWMETKFDDPTTIILLGDLK